MGLFNFVTGFATGLYAGLYVAKNYNVPGKEIILICFLELVQV